MMTNSPTARRLILSFALCITLGLLLPPTAHAVEAGAPAAQGLKVGQVWRYDGPPGNEGSRVIIGKLETLPVLGDAVHISITNVKLTDPQTGKPITVTIQHLPMSVSALKASLTEQDGTEMPSEAFEAGYFEWRKNFDNKKSGIFTVPIKEVLTSIKAVAADPTK